MTSHPLQIVGAAPTFGIFLVATIATLAAAALAGCSKKTAATQAEPPSVVATPAKVAAPMDTRSEDAGSRARAGKREDRHDSVDENGAPLALEVKIGDTTTTWRQEAFDKVPRFAAGSTANDGEQRETWSLRELARVLVGPHARVIVVAGPDEVRTLTSASWTDATRTPILHTTRRGTLKFRWASAAGRWADTEVRDVSRLEIQP